MIPDHLKGPGNINAQTSKVGVVMRNVKYKLRRQDLPFQCVSKVTNYSQHFLSSPLSQIYTHLGQSLKEGHSGCENRMETVGVRKCHSSPSITNLSSCQEISFPNSFARLTNMSTGSKKGVVPLDGEFLHLPFLPSTKAQPCLEAASMKEL